MNEGYETIRASVSKMIIGSMSKLISVSRLGNCHCWRCVDFALVHLYVCGFCSGPSLCWSIPPRWLLFFVQCVMLPSRLHLKITYGQSESVPYFSPATNSMIQSNAVPTILQNASYRLCSSILTEITCSPRSSILTEVNAIQTKLCDSRFLTQLRNTIPGRVFNPAMRTLKRESSCGNFLMRTNTGDPAKTSVNTA